MTKEVLAHFDAIRANPRGRRIGVLGLGTSGRAMAMYLVHRGAHVVAADRRSNLNDPELIQMGVELRLGDMSASTFADVETLAISPGADPRQIAVRAAADRETPVVGELELAGTLPARVLAITGTNGKSTATALSGELVKAAGKSAFVGANLGDPVLGWLDRHDRRDVAVLELSSYQLETAYRFVADVGVMLNVTPDHLDRYDDMTDYAAAKARLIANLGKDGVAVLNADDPLVTKMAPDCAGKIYWFSTHSPSVPASGAFVQNDQLVFCGELADWEPISLAHPRLLGRHNRENAAAALLAVRGLDIGARPEDLIRGYLGFSGLAHRLEIVDEVNGVLYVNDSKATNDDAAAIAVSAMTRPVVLLLGGRDKAGGYARVRAEAAAKARLVIVYGEAGDLIAGALADHPGMMRVAGFAQAFATATQSAQKGEVVLLAPACSSFDEFTDYKARGERFRALTRVLRGNAP